MNSLRPTNDITVFAIFAPGYASALTRSGGTPSAALHAKILAALPDYDTADLEFKQGDSGRWYVRTINNNDIADSHEGACDSCFDTDINWNGDHPCERCAEGGKFVVGVENDKLMTRGTCFRCAGKGYHNRTDRRRNSAHDAHYAMKG